MLAKISCFTVLFIVDNVLVPAFWHLFHGRIPKVVVNIKYSATIFIFHASHKNNETRYIEPTMRAKCRYIWAWRFEETNFQQPSLLEWSEEPYCKFVLLDYIIEQNMVNVKKFWMQATGFLRTCHVVSISHWHFMRDAYYICILLQRGSADYLFKFKSSVNHFLWKCKDKSMT